MTSLPERIVLATANEHKVAEIRQILPMINFVARPADVSDVIEDAGTLVGNARLKADAICAATGLPALADDTGLFVDALGGEPGVETAYFAGPEANADRNVAKMLQALDGQTNRAALFVTVALLRFADGSEIVAQGEVLGVVATQRLGSSGFGYDPIFVPNDGDGRAFAEMTADEKATISHRARAMKSLAEMLGAALPVAQVDVPHVYNRAVASDD
ncbi:MAG: RdgB/HAM1 family non-canonical purine NTP pyrophosphatase [Actinobacteria bacterium]|nr:RdgB/HAM1 family non-canonical purine NTP pyrophosphatase [Actinomycetota bacterium]